MSRTACTKPTSSTPSKHVLTPSALAQACQTSLKTDQQSEAWCQTQPRATAVKQDIGKLSMRAEIVHWAPRRKNDTAVATCIALPRGAHATSRAVQTRVHHHVKQGKQVHPKPFFPSTPKSHASWNSRVASRLFLGLPSMPHDKPTVHTRDSTGYLHTYHEFVLACARIVPPFS